MSAELTFNGSEFESVSQGSPSLVSRNGQLLVGLDAAASEGVVFRGRLPAGYAAGGLNVTVRGMAESATSNAVVVSVSFERGTTDLDADSFASAKTGTLTANATSGILFEGTITFSNSEIDGLTAGDRFRIKVERLGGDGSDTMTADFQLDSVVIVEPAGSATPAELGSASAGSGSTPSLENHVHPTTITNRGGENVTLDLAPSFQQQGTVNTAGSITIDVAIPVSRRGTITADVWVEDGSADILYCKAIVVRFHRKSSGDAILISTSVIDDPYSTAAFTFVASVSTSNIRFTLANTSGTNRSYNLIGGAVFCDKP